MPRKENRGGPRVGTPGRNYQNRSDLRGAQPIATAPNQPYGVAGQQAAAQRIQPLPAVPAPAPTAVPPVAPPGPVPGGVDLSAPSERPGEHVMAGSSVGPGPGPEALGPPNPLVTAATILNSYPSLGAEAAALRARINAALANQAAP